MSDKQPQCDFNINSIEPYKEQLVKLLRGAENLRQTKFVYRLTDYLSITEALHQMQIQATSCTDASTEEVQGMGGQVLKAVLDTTEQITKIWSMLDAYTTLILLTKLSSSVRAVERVFSAKSPLTHFFKREHHKLRTLYRFFFEGVVKSFEDKDFKSPMSLQASKLTSPYLDNTGQMKRQPSHLELDPMDFSKNKSAPDDGLLNTRINFNQKRTNINDKFFGTAPLPISAKSKNTSSFSVGDRNHTDSPAKPSIKKSMMNSTNAEAADSTKDSFNLKSEEQKRSFSLRLGTVIHQKHSKLEKSHSKSRIISEADIDVCRTKSLVVNTSKEIPKKMHSPQEDRSSMRDNLKLCSSPQAWYALLTQPRILLQALPRSHLLSLLRNRRLDSNQTIISCLFRNHSRSQPKEIRAQELKARPHNLQRVEPPLQ